MIVMKFGGTSVENADAIRNVVQLINRHLKRRPLIVVSACAGTTDALVRMADHAEKGQLDAALRILLLQRQRHLEICSQLLVDGYHESACIELKRRFSDLARRLHGVSILRELTPSVRDSILSAGESWSVLLLTYALQQDGRDAIWIPAERLIVTDDRHGEASPKPDATASHLLDDVIPHMIHGKIVVTQGFVGATSDGRVTTLGRGGSDFTAGILGELLGAEEIQIWTDVNGLRSADPRVVPQTRLHPLLGYRDAERLATLGAKVLHPKTIEPAARRRIPIRILNTSQPDENGTLIGVNQNEPVFCITYKTGLSLISINGAPSSWLNQVLPDAEAVQADPSGVQLLIQSDCVKIPVRHYKNRVAMCWVTQPEWNTASLARALLLLNDARISVYSVFHRDMSMGFAVDELDLVETIRRLHELDGDPSQANIAKSA